MSMTEKLRKKTCRCANRRLHACQADIKSSSVGAECVLEILKTTKNKKKKVNVSIIIWHFFVSREKVSVGCAECGSVPDEQTGLPPRSKQVFQSFAVPSRDYNFNDTSGESNIHPNTHLLEWWKLTFQHAAISSYLSKKKRVLFILKYFKFCGLDLLAKSLFCKEEGMLCLSNPSQLFTWFHFFPHWWVFKYSTSFRLLTGSATCQQSGHT